MKNIYLILTYTGTIISKMIKGVTKDKYCHISIALDIELKEMYSFGRIYPCTPLIAGFVHEDIHGGTFKRFYNTDAKVLRMEVADEQYEKIKEIIYQFKSEHKKYKFNFLGLCAAGLNKKLRIKNYFYCAEFIKYILEEAGIDTNLPEIVKPEHFNELKNIEEIYTGYLREYKLAKILSRMNKKKIAMF